jgi:hypothetical protein
VQRDRVYKVHLIAQPGEPAGVDARPPADVGHDRGRLRKVPPEDLLRPGELEPPHPPCQPTGFESGRVMVIDLGRAGRVVVRGLRHRYYPQEAVAVPPYGASLRAEGSIRTGFSAEASTLR